jgi:hypothetical protein
MLLAAPEPGAGIVPRLVKFSGVLKDRMGKVPTGEVGLTCSLHELPEVGSPLWIESDTVRLDKEGRYTVLLESSFPEGMPLDLFTSDHELWLGVQAQLPGEGEQPRIDIKALNSTATSDAIPATPFGMRTGPRIQDLLRRMNFLRQGQATGFRCQGFRARGKAVSKRQAQTTGMDSTGANPVPKPRYHY